MYERIKYICDNEGIAIDKKAAASLVRNNYPDYRSVVNKIQTLILQGVTNITEEDISSVRSEYGNIYEIVMGPQNPENNYKLLAGEYGNKVDDVLNSLGKDFIEYIIREKQDYIKFIPHITITVAKYQNQRFAVIDPVVTMLACVFELQEIFKAK